MGQSGIMVWACLLSGRRGPREGFRVRSHHRRELDAQGAVPGLLDGKVSMMRQVLGIEK